VKFGPLAAEIVSLVWGTPANFNGFHVLAALLRSTSSERPADFAPLNRERHLYSAGRPSRWSLAHILVFFSTMSRGWLGGMSPKWSILCRVGCNFHLVHFVIMLVINNHLCGTHVQQGLTCVHVSLGNGVLLLIPYVADGLALLVVPLF